MAESDFPEIDEIDKSVEELETTRKSISDRKHHLSRRRKQLVEELEKLKDWIWKTDNPNIVELRRELLAVAKLVYDENEEFEEDEDEDDTIIKSKHLKPLHIDDIFGDYDIVKSIKDKGIWTKKVQRQK